MCLVHRHMGRASIGLGACMQVKGQQWDGTRIRWPHSATPPPAMMWSLGLKTQWVQENIQS